MKAFGKSSRSRAHTGRLRFSCSVSRIMNQVKETPSAAALWGGGELGPQVTEKGHSVAFMPFVLWCLRFFPGPQCCRINLSWLDCPRIRSSSL